MIKKKVLFICSNPNILKEKIMLSMMVITNKGYEIDVVTSEEVDIPFTSEKYIIPSLNSDNYNEVKKDSKLLNEMLSRKKYSIVHTFDNYSSFLLQETKYKNSIVDLNVYVENAISSISRLKNIIKIADNVIVNNEEDYEYLLKRKLNTNINLVYDLAIDFRKYKSLNLEELKEKTRKKYGFDYEKKYVYISDINENELYIYKVVSEIYSQNSNVVFLFAEMNKKLENYIEKNNLKDCIKVTEDIKLLEILLISDAVLYTKIYNYDIMMLIYSLMFGIPVILPKNNYLEKYIDELKNGFFVENNNVQKTVLAIGRSVNIPKVKLNELVEYNYSKISCFSVDKYIYNLSQLYKEVTSNPPKDIYLIESLKKSIESERLMNDIKNQGAISAEIIVIENSINDEKIKSLGAEIKKFDISSFNGKYKLKKYIESIKVNNDYNSFSVYGKMYKILKNNKIVVSNDSMVVEYRKI